MDAKTVVWVECHVGEGEESFFFRGATREQAEAEGRKAFKSLAIPPEELTFNNYVARKRVATTRRCKKALAKRALANQ